MAPLPQDLRRALERAVVDARETAEAGAANALAVLAVEEDRAPDSLSASDRALRVALRARARSLGGGSVTDASRAALREEIAYAAWHRMLFARFLAENGLLVEPDSRVPVSMEDVAELARELREPDSWVLAARYAAEMLPGIFGTTDPTTRVAYAPDDRLKLEAILKALPTALFSADDALGWVYQFWQSKRKDEVNAAGQKVCGANLAPVTQLFTEHYMVRFLLENSLGAWWAGRHPDSPLRREWDYLRYRDDGTPAAGTFEGWPTRAAEITVMDPCMGSGHFLAAAADMLRKMRIEEEGLTAAAAAEAVIRDNLFGLELDPRCTQLGAFALAFDAWKAAGGYRALPVPSIACSGIAVKGQLDDWRRLAGDDDNLRAGLERLYELFQDAPELGSLIDPRTAAGEGLWAVDADRLLEALQKALARETEDPAAAVFGAAAQGTAKAARLLAGRYWLVATNPPFLGDGDQGQTLRQYLLRSDAETSGDLAVAFCRRAKAFVHSSGGTYLVLPQAWTSQPTYREFRRQLLAASRLSLVARLGARAFRAISGEVVNVVLVGLHPGSEPEANATAWIDVAAVKGVDDKADGLRMTRVQMADQLSMLANPDHFVSSSSGRTLGLSSIAQAYQGIKTGDDGRRRRLFWELLVTSDRWRRMQTTTDHTAPVGGATSMVDWSDRGRSLARLQGISAWNRIGIAVSLMGKVEAALYHGDVFDSNIAALVPINPRHAPAIWAFVESGEYATAVRQIEGGIKINSATAAKVPFDLDHWSRVAAEQYPDGLPEPHSDDLTQWLFKGNIVGSEAPLHVAVARLLGYRWPDQVPGPLDVFADPDGIVCLPAVGEAPASERLERLLAAAYRSDWSNAKRAELLAASGGKAQGLGAWLRDELFEQHARLFHNRPFIWHVWDGRRDGFSALLHYHRIDRQTLEKLTYAHLGEWLERQRAGAKAGEAGADSRLKAAQDLQTKLGAILGGEPPYDLYVRWKSLAEQPIGWKPDLDDGVRLNIRPFVTAGVLRAKFSINWNKDRGTDPDGSERLNDRHFTVAEKRAAREGRR
jgi:hypothetical protein